MNTRSDYARISSDDARRFDAARRRYQIERGNRHATVPIASGARMARPELVYVPVEPKNAMEGE